MYMTVSILRIGSMGIGSILGRMWMIFGGSYGGLEGGKGEYLSINGEVCWGLEG
jgi:hypothetical protein